VAGNLQFRGIVFCNLGTSKIVISKFVTTRQILLPHILPRVNMTTPTMFPWDKKASIMKKVFLNNVLIPWYPISYLTITGYVFFLGAYWSIPDAAIWWCLQTGGGGMVTS
jgi:hypothetical protein